MSLLLVLAVVVAGGLIYARVRARKNPVQAEQRELIAAQRQADRLRRAGEKADREADRWQRAAERAGPQQAGDIQSRAAQARRRSAELRSQAAAARKLVAVARERLDAVAEPAATRLLSPDIEQQ